MFSISQRKCLKIYIEWGPVNPNIYLPELFRLLREHLRTSKNANLIHQMYNKEVNSTQTIKHVWSDTLLPHSVMLAMQTLHKWAHSATLR